MWHVQQIETRPHYNCSADIVFTTYPERVAIVTWSAFCSPSASRISFWNLWWMAKKISSYSYSKLFHKVTKIKNPWQKVAFHHFQTVQTALWREYIYILVLRVSYLSSQWWKNSLDFSYCELTVLFSSFSSLFPDVVNCMQTDNLELKKLVYLYLMNYAKSQPDMAIMAVNSFVKARP